jgi:hypothetical protein
VTETAVHDAARLKPLEKVAGSWRVDDEAH